MGMDFAVREIWMNVHMDFPIAVIARRSGLHASEDCVEVERDRILEKLNQDELENEHIKYLILKKDAAIMTMNTGLLLLKKNVASMKAEKGPLSKSNTKLPASTKDRDTNKIRTGEGIYCT